MTRKELNPRRANFTAKIVHQWDAGREQKVVVTYGLDPSRRRVQEVFCSDFKEGTDLHTLIMDACVCLSLLLQHGYGVKELRSKLAPAPKSLLHTILEEAVRYEEENN